MTIRAATLLVVTTVLASTAGACAAAEGKSMYTSAVARICARSILFAGSHEIGTRAGAIAVSKAIRRTGLNRLRRVAAITKPRATAALDTRWLGLEHRLVKLYAATYLRIWYVIKRSETPRGRGSLPGRLRALIDLPRPLERKVRQLEELLNVPDCTGGIPPTGAPAP